MAGHWVVGRNGAYGYNHPYLGDAESPLYPREETASIGEGSKKGLSRSLASLLHGSTLSPARVEFIHDFPGGGTVEAEVGPDPQVLAREGTRPAPE